MYAFTRPNRSLRLLESLDPIQKPPLSLQEASLSSSSSLEHSTRAAMKGSLWHFPTVLFFPSRKLRDLAGFCDVEGGGGRTRLRLAHEDEEDDEEEEREEEDCLSFLHLGVCFLGMPGSCSQENGIPKDTAGLPL
ncbi:hypothetical protein SAY86_013979 [Trapa natans]|uniref:Uncharacterized protein n=1 Tax=Trapa natans TaxID=22666 RepID=A0AAN7QMD3_TRANT|nr:hypothetical protein SAY86_013979 [Trapa natans]